MLCHNKLRSYGVSLILLLAASFGSAAAPASADVSETILHTFGAGYDGQAPSGGLVQAADGTLYGATVNGGTADYGTAFKISSSGSYTVLHNFDDGSVANDGLRPYDTLTLGSDGNLYGTTEVGGATSHGAVFKMTTAGAVTILHSFAGGSDGENPIGGVTFGTDGKLYGTTIQSDSDSSAEYGTVYSLSTSGSGYLVQYRFNDGNSATVGNEPFCTLIQVPGSTSNQFYGTCDMGGDENEGTVFKFTPHTTDGGGAIDVLHSFPEDGGAADGERPYLGSLAIDSSGNLYGDTSQGGVDNDGIVYKLTPSGSETILHTFGSGSSSDGQYPYGGLMQASDGNFYGTTAEGGTNADGTVYRLSSTGSGFTVIHSFGSDSNDGAGPQSPPLEDTDGNLVGMTRGGGYQGYGVLYKLAANLPGTVSLSSVYLSPTSTPGGTSTTANRAYLSGNATANTTVTLTSSNTSIATVPSSVLIKTGSSSHTFTITTKSLTSTQTVTITAKANGVTKTAKLTITPASATLSSVNLSPASTEGGTTTTANRAYLTGNATADTTVTFTSSNTAVAKITTTPVTIKTGSSSHVFTIATTAVTASTPVTITATANGVSKASTLTVTP